MVMKAAIISDIHGNLEALKAVLIDIQDHGVEKIYVLGDLAFCGPEPNETVDYIRQHLSDHVIIQGNTDEMILKATGEEDDIYTPKKEVMACALFYSQKVLSEENKNFLAQLPATYSENFDILPALFVHGSPRKNDEGIFPDVKYSKLDEIMEGIEAKIIFCGHTHYPIIHQSSGRTVVNVGSVGRPFGENPRAVYAIFDYSKVAQREFDVEHRYVPYDTKAASEKLEQCDFEGADTLAYMLRLATDKFPTPAELN
ncbi:MAG: metallophosphoesterase family protein [Cyanobacteriota bacterium]